MLTHFKDKILSIKGVSASTPTFLLGVSGGIDSMCMAELFFRSAIAPFAIAHVNFSLRGDESDGDEALVCEWAKSRNIPFYRAKFDTHQYAQERGISTQMAARELRYNWFEELMENGGYDYLAIAHNLNDSVETLFINLLRGTGVRGLAGIREQGRVIRPLMDFTREQIVEFVQSNSIAYRDDRTNSESHYARNRIRNLIFPHFKEINPSFLQTLKRDIDIFNETSDIIDELFTDVKRDILIQSNNNIGIKAELEISIDKLRQRGHISYWLYMLLEPYGFNSSLCRDISISLESESGTKFLSGDYLLIKDRESLILYNNANKERSDSFEIELQMVDGALDLTPYNFRISLADSIDSKALINEIRAAKTNAVQYIDADKLKWPLTLRPWKSGDKFIPIGMSGYKKVSDFLVDIKLNVFEKEMVMVLLSGDDIVMLPGLRIDDRYKLNDKSKRLLKIVSSKEATS